MIRRPPRSTRTDSLFPYTTLFRSDHVEVPGRILMELREILIAHRIYAAARLVGRQTQYCDLENWQRSDCAAQAICAAGGDAGSTINGARVGLRSIRSEERRVGKECVSTCRYRGSQYN